MTKVLIKPIATKIINFAKEQYNIRVIIDPKGSDYSMYNGAYLIKPNELEFETIVGKPKNKTRYDKEGARN